MALKICTSFQPIFKPILTLFYEILILLTKTQMNQ